MKSNALLVSFATPGIVNHDALFVDCRAGGFEPLRTTPRMTVSITYHRQLGTARKRTLPSILSKAFGKQARKRYNPCSRS